VYISCENAAKFFFDTAESQALELINEISPNEKLSKRNRPIYPTQTQQGVNWTLGKILLMVGGFSNNSS
jgi:hypothetical protein